MKKAFAVILAAMLISILAVGCTPKTNATAPEQKTTVPADSENQEETANQEEAPQDIVEEKSSEIIIEAQGTYNGQIDNNFIEIKLETADNPAEFDISEVTDSLKGLNIGDKIKITYIVNENGQNILKSIEKAN